MPFFSIVIPLYNKETFISSTIQSVLGQTFSDFEVIIVDDCSTDKSLSVAKQMKDSRIQIIKHSENKGLSASRNTGIKNAKANYIAFLDADDIWKPNFLQTIESLISDFPKAALYATKYELLLKNNKRVSHNFIIPEFKGRGIISNFFESNLNQAIYYPSCLCVKKEVFEEVGYYNESITYSEDIDFNIRAHAKYKLAYSEKVLVTYLLVSENQITQSGLKGRIIPDYDSYEEQFKERDDIKRYLDFQRYVKGKLYKVSGDRKNYLQITRSIDFRNLNWKQRMLIRLPRVFLIWVTKIKLILQNIGVSVNSYSN